MHNCSLKATSCLYSALEPFYSMVHLSIYNHKPTKWVPTSALSTHHSEVPQKNIGLGSESRATMIFSAWRQPCSIQALYEFAYTKKLVIYTWKAANTISTFLKCTQCLSVIGEGYYLFTTLGSHLIFLWLPVFLLLQTPDTILLKTRNITVLACNFTEKLCPEDQAQAWP